MGNRVVAIAAGGVVALFGMVPVGWAQPRCPTAVTDAALKAFPGAQLVSCKPETEHGKSQFEVKVDTSRSKRIELDISPDGALLLTEEQVALGEVPSAVLAAFSAKYPLAKAERAEKQTKGDGTVSYEIAFLHKGKRHEATFASDGAFIELE